MSRRERLYAVGIGLVVLASLAMMWLAWTLPGPDALEDVAPESQQAASGTIAGAVVDVAGDPIAGATVSAGDLETQADAEGRFIFEGLETGEVLLDAAAKGFVSPGPAAVRGLRVTLGDGDSPRSVRDLRLVLRRPGVLSGRVVAGGQPVEGAALDAAWSWAEGIGGVLKPFHDNDMGVTGPGGRFELRGVAPGRLRLAARAAGHPTGRSGEISLTDGGEVGDIVIDLQPLGRVSGRVQGAAGAMAADVVLSCEAGGRPLRARAGADGRFDFEDVPGGKCTVSAQAPGHVSSHVPTQVRPGAVAQVTVQLQPADGVVGRVLDLQDQPVLGAWVVVRAGGQERTVRAGHGGEFSLSARDLDLRGATAIAVSATHSPSAERPVVAGEEVILRLGPGGWITGSVVDGAGQPVTGALVTLDGARIDPPNPISRPMVMPARSEANGAFRIGPLRPGSYDLRAERHGLAAGFARGISVSADAIQSGVRIVLSGGATLRGRVTARDGGEALAGAAVTLYEPGSLMPPRRARTDAEGRYSIDGLSPGLRSVRFEHPAYLTELSSGLQVPAEGEVVRDMALGARQAGERFKFQGIGATLGQTAKGVVIRNTMEGSPAERFGLKNGDLILGVDYQPVDGKGISQIVELIRGQAGQPVSLDIERPGSGRMTISVERGEVVVKGQ